MDVVSALQVAAALVLNASFAWLLGSWFARRWMRTHPTSSDGFEPWLNRVDLAVAGIAVISCVAGLLASTAVMGGVGLVDACPMFGLMLTSTALGHAGCVATLAMIVLLVLRWTGRIGIAAEMAAAILLVAFALTRASMGHAGEDGFLTTVYAAEAIHLLAIGLWTGTVFVSAWYAVNEANVARNQPGYANQYLEMMSRASMLAVLALLATGVYGAWQRVGSSDALVHTFYGGTLLAKVALVLAAIALGGYNKFVGMPFANRSPDGLRTVRLILRVESCVLLGAILAAAILTVQQPPSSM